MITKLEIDLAPGTKLMYTYKKSIFLMIVTSDNMYKFSKLGENYKLDLSNKTKNEIIEIQQILN